MSLSPKVLAGMADELDAIGKAVLAGEPADTTAALAIARTLLLDAWQHVEPEPTEVTDSPHAAAGLTRLTVNVTDRAMGALNAAAEVRGDSKTDVVNQALIVYGSIAEALADGSRALVGEARS